MRDVFCIDEIGCYWSHGDNLFQWSNNTNYKIVQNGTTLTIQVSSGNSGTWNVTYWSDAQ